HRLPTSTLFPYTMLFRSDPTLVVYAALPHLVIAAALAAASHLQDNPLNAFALGVLVTRLGGGPSSRLRLSVALPAAAVIGALVRSEEHTSELQSPDHLVC